MGTITVPLGGRLLFYASRFEGIARDWYSSVT